jgi:hypothetical protein
MIEREMMEHNPGVRWIDIAELHEVHLHSIHCYNYRNDVMALVIYGPIGETIVRRSCGVADSNARLFQRHSSTMERRINVWTTW